MRRIPRVIPQRARAEKDKPIVVKIDPKAAKSSLTVPKVKYEVVTTIEEESVFHGSVVPIPKVLLFLLTHSELLVFITVMEQTNEEGLCTLRVPEIAKRLRFSRGNISRVLYNLRLLGLLKERGDGNRGAGRIRQINFSTVQHLDDLAEGEDFGVYLRIRKAVRKKRVDILTKEDVKSAYDNTLLEPGHDPAEEEEYD